MKVVFIVQGEGRGHLTQAIEFKRILSTQGYELCCCLVSKSSKRSIPSYFESQIGTEVIYFESLIFGYDKHFRGISYFNTFCNLFKYIFICRRNLKLIRRNLELHSPDLVVNFYEFSSGIYHLFFAKKSYKLISIAHQFYVGRMRMSSCKVRLQQIIFGIANKLNSYGSDKVFALSLANEDLGSDRTICSPPIIDTKSLQGLRDISTLKKEKSVFLVYIVNPGYKEDILKGFFKSDGRNYRVDVFWDGEGMKYNFESKQIVFHSISRTKFLSKLASCDIFVSTAGFESICEAAYLGKKIYLNPVKNQIEQVFNSIDAVNNGIAKKVLNFGLLPVDTHANPGIGSFKIWVESSEDFYLDYISKLFK